MAGNTGDMVTPTAALFTQGVRFWAADPVLATALRAALQPGCKVTVYPALPDAATVARQGVLLLVPSPAEALCAALQNGAELAVALTQVQTEAEAVLALWRQARRQVVLADAAAARLAPAALLDLCGVKMAEMETDAGWAAQECLRNAAGDGPDVQLLALARDRLQASPRLRWLAAEFVAAAVPLAQPKPEDSDRALLNWLATRDGDEERVLLQAQQFGMYEQMEQLYGEKLTLEARLEQVQSEAEVQEARQEQERSALKAKLQQLQDCLRIKSEVLEVAGGRLADMEQVAQAQAQQVAGLKGQLHQMRNSRSFRLMAALRSARRRLRGSR